MRMATLLMILVLAGCATTYDNNPRNMKNMTTDEIVRELSQVQP